MKKFLILIVLSCTVFSNTAFGYTLSKTDTRIATNKVKVLNERIQKGTLYSTIYKQQLNIQNNIKKNRDRKNIKSVAYKNLDRNYAVLQYILENLIDTTNRNNINIQVNIVQNKNCDDGWYYNEGVMNCQPNNPIKSCNISNGIGKQTWNGNGWNSCSVVSCNSGYSASNGVCLANQPTQQSTPIINQPSCSSFQHLENNICVSNSKSCSILNGVGEQTWNGSSYGSCNIVSCNTGYENIGGSTSCSLVAIASQYPGCNMPDITLGDKVWAACNVGSSVAGFGTESYGSYYQWGRNKSIGTSPITIGPILNDETNDFIINPTKSNSSVHWDWQNPQNHNAWGDISDNVMARQGPCASGYHIPKITDWYGLAEDWNALRLLLKLSLGGSRASMDGAFYQVGITGTYWTSSINGGESYGMYFNNNGGGERTVMRAEGNLIRCIKN